MKYGQMPIWLDMLLSALLYFAVGYVVVAFVTWSLFPLSDKGIRSLVAFSALLAVHFRRLGT